MNKFGVHALVWSGSWGAKECEYAISSTREAGYHQALWDGRNNAGATVSSGLYIYRFETAEFHKSQKMMLLK